MKQTILEADIIELLKGGNRFATADVYKQLGGKKSKDVRTQLDSLYKQGEIERTKIRNSYYWNLKLEDIENNDEMQHSKITEDQNEPNLYQEIIKLLKEEIRFLCCTVNDLLNMKQSENKNSEKHKSVTIETPSSNNIFPTQTPVLHATTSAPTPPLPPLSQHANIVPRVNTTNFITPKRVVPFKPANPIAVPLNNRFEVLQVEEAGEHSEPQTMPANLHPNNPSLQQEIKLPRPLGNPRINNKPENDHLPEILELHREKRVPKSKRKMKIGLIGDSNFNRIYVQEMNGLIRNAELSKLSYSGATSLHLGHYIDVLLSEEPDSVLIHAGTNDLWGRNKRRVTSERIARDIINIGAKCKTKGVKTIFISSILMTTIDDSNKISFDVNSLLKLMCVGHNFIYIDNDFLGKDDLDDEVHLSWDGRRKLVDNYIEFLNN